MTSVTIAQLRATATVDLMTAARALGLGRTKAYELARRQQFPCRVLRICDTFRVPTAGLLELLGLVPDEPNRNPCRQVRLRAASVALHARAPWRSRAACCRRRAAGTRRPIATQCLGVAAGAEPFRRLDAHRLRRAH